MRLRPPLEVTRFVGGLWDALPASLAELSWHYTPSSGAHGLTLLFSDLLSGLIFRLGVEVAWCHYHPLGVSPLSRIPPLLSIVL